MDKYTKPKNKAVLKSFNIRFAIIHGTYIEPDPKTGRASKILTPRAIITA